MTNRTTAVIITIVAVLLCLCPGLALLCFGITDFIDHYYLNSYIYGIYNQTAANWAGIAGLCVGVLFIAIAIVVMVIVMRRKKETPPPTTNEPIPPAF